MPSVDLDAEDRHPLVGERQRDEAEHVHGPDEEEERRHVREPAADRLRRQPLLGDLGLRDFVDLLADRLARVGATPTRNRIVKIPSAIVTIEARIKYATALLIDMSIGPMWIGIHAGSSNSWDGSNSSSVVPVSATARTSVFRSAITRGPRA